MGPFSYQAISNESCISAVVQLFFSFLSSFCTLLIYFFLNNYPYFMSTEFSCNLLEFFSICVKRVWCACKLFNIFNTHTHRQLASKVNNSVGSQSASWKKSCDSFWRCTLILSFICVYISKVACFYNAFLRTLYIRFSYYCMFCVSHPLHPSWLNRFGYKLPNLAFQKYHTL